MSDYLNNLAARSTGRGEQFRPRLPSLFEPASDRTTSSIARFDLEDAGIHQIEDAEGSDNQGEQRDRPAEDATLGRHGPQLEGEPDDVRQSRMRTPAAAHQALESAEPGDPRLPYRQQPPGEEIKARAPVASDSSGSSLERHEEKFDPTSNAQGETATTKHRRSALTRQAPTLGLSRDDLRAVNQGAQAKAPTGVVEKSLDPPFDQGLNRDHSPFSRGYSSTQFESADNGRIENGPAPTPYSEAAGPGERRGVTPASLRAQPASTIKVTIGRVEVRAILNESQPRRPESVKAKPRMTLDEYLKQRNGGQR